MNLFVWRFIFYILRLLGLVLLIVKWLIVHTRKCLSFLSRSGSALAWAIAVSETRPSIFVMLHTHQSRRVSISTTSMFTHDNQFHMILLRYPPFHPLFDISMHYRMTIKFQFKRGLIAILPLLLFLIELSYSKGLFGTNSCLRILDVC